MPHLVFAKLELTLWRSLAAWVDISAFRDKIEGGNGLDVRGRNRYVVQDNNSSGWITLPFEASVWPDNYDYKRHGFVPGPDGEGAHRAFAIIIGPERYPFMERLEELVVDGTNNELRAGFQRVTRSKEWMALPREWRDIADSDEFLGFLVGGRSVYMD